MKKLNKKGFTLLELLAVLVIMAALAVIAIPIFLNKGTEARLQAHKANIRAITDAIQRYEWENGTQAAPTANFHGLLNDTNLLVTGKVLAAAPASPYAGVTGYKNFQYCIGVYGGRTAVKLVAVDNDAAPVDLAIIDDDGDAGTTTDDTKVTDATTILTSGAFKTDGTVFEVPDTAAAGSNPTKTAVS